MLFAILCGLLFYCPLSAQIDSMFYFVDKTTLTNDVICPYTDSTYWGKYDGHQNIKCKNLSATTIYRDLQNWTLGVNTRLSADSNLTKAYKEIQDQNRIALFIINYQYTKVKLNALKDSLLTLENGIYHDVVPRAQTPFENDTLFVATPLIDKIHFGSKTFLISRDYYISNLPDPTQIQIDFDDGLGYRNVAFGQSITINYANDTVRHILTKFIYPNYTLGGGAESAIENCACGYPNIDEFINQASTIPVTSPAPYNIYSNYGQQYDPNITGISYANVYLKYGAGHYGQLVKPLIFVEGIDFGYHSDFSGLPCSPYTHTIRNGDVGWCEFWGENLDYPEFKHSPQLLNSLLAQGYDIMFVDFLDGADFIQRNAMVLVSLLNTIQTRQATGGYYHEPSVVIGASMGGQVAKYALDYMEQNGMKHCTRTYASFDSPQQGANIPLSLQQWLNFFAKKGDIPIIQSTPLENVQSKLDRPATRQLLVRHYDVNNDSQYRTPFQTMMNNLGYPKRLRKVAISCGSKTGVKQLNFADGQKMLATNWAPLLCGATPFIQGDCWSTGNSQLFLGRTPKATGIACLSFIASNSILCPPCGTLLCFACANINSNFGHENIIQSTTLPLWDNAPGGYRKTAVELATEYNDALPNGFGSATSFPGAQDAKECFIPTISALDLNTGNLTIAVTTYLPNDNFPLPNLYPFDAYYASNDNIGHVELENMAQAPYSNLDWSLKEILNSEPILPWILSTNSPNSGVYNFGRIQNKLLTKCKIENGAKLYVNGNLQTDFAGGTLPMPSVGTSAPIQGSLFEMQTCDCNGVVVEIKSGAEFILGEANPNNKAIVHFNSGSTLIIRNGGKLKINDNSKLIIESGATIIYEPGAEIQLLGDNAVLDIAGTLDIKDNATFTFTHPGTNGGYIRMSNTTTWPSKNIIAGTNCKMEFIGSGKLDKVLEIAQESLYDPQNHNFVHVHIINGLVDFTYNDARIAMDSKKYFANSTFIANGGAKGVSRGIEFYGNGTDYIQNCDFKNLNNGISGSLFYGGHPLSVSLCNFSNCTQPIKIVGEALYARDINMNFCTKGIQLEATTKASYIHNVFFESSGQNGYGFKINNSTGAPVYIDNSTVNNGLICAGGSVGIDGVQLEGGDLNIKCSVFSNMDNGISVGNGGFIDLSTLSENGYVNLTNNYFALKFDKAEGFQFQNGFNNFAFMDDACQVSTQVNIIGSILKPLAGPAINTNCDNNGWYAPGGSQLFAPPINLINYDLELCSQSQGQCTPLLLTDASPSPYSGCSHDDPCPSPPCDIAARVSLNNVRNITTAYFNNIPLDEAINDAFGATDTTLASVMNAMNLLSEIIDVNMANPTIDEQFADGFAYRGMQQTLSLMTSLKQKFGLTTNLQTYFSNLLTKIDSKINDAVALGDSDRFTFYTLDKAQVYMLKNDFDAALLVLNNLKNNSIVTNIEYINYWHCIASLQNQVLLGTLDKTEFIASLTACVPLQYARYQTANIKEPNHNNFEGDNNFNINSIDGTINLTYKSSLNENVTITIYDALGNRLLNQTEKMQIGINKFEFKNLNLSQAIYLMQCTTATAKQSRKFLVQ